MKTCPNCNEPYRGKPEQCEICLVDLYPIPFTFKYLPKNTKTQKYFCEWHNFLDCFIVLSWCDIDDIETLNYEMQFEKNKPIYDYFKMNFCSDFDFRKRMLKLPRYWFRPPINPEILKWRNEKI